MPELPEVETVVNDIRPKILGKKISKIKLPSNYKRAIGNANLSSINKSISNSKIKAVKRRAKYIVLHLESGGVLAVHLRMTGRLITKINKEDKKYVTLTLHFKDKSYLAFRDVRKFGRWDYFKKYEDLDNKLGVEPLEKDFNFVCLKNLCKSKKKRMKHLLLDQTIIAGLGNIYVDEALFAAGVHPESLSNKVPDENLKLLSLAIKRILKKSIKSSGTTFSSFYYGDSKKGNFEATLRVYGREGEPCKNCKGKITKIRVQQRGTHICKKCQKLFV